MTIRRAISGEIIIYEDSEFVWRYENDNHSATVDYLLKRNPITHKFPTLQIYYYFNASRGKKYGGCVFIPKYNLDFGKSMIYDDNADVLHTALVLDVNKYDNVKYYVFDNPQVIKLNICTSWEEK